MSEELQTSGARMIFACIIPPHMQRIKPQNTLLLINDLLFFGKQVALRVANVQHKQDNYIYGYVSSTTISREGRTGQRLQ